MELEPQDSQVHKDHKETQVPLELKVSLEQMELMVYLVLMD